ncbi:MAG: limonene-1,2-epoxide hydrolase [Alphaproteobacteria bacterium]|nr:limonene-1,2-epoxide hydrolase [Alphaproteobacteria bacterium]
MKNNDQIISDFAAAWQRLDADELAGYFAEDAVYHNIPMEIITGRENIRKFLAEFLAGTSGVTFEIRHQISSGNLVFNERVDHSIWGDKKVALPVAGVFELENGKIKAWRDYFDLEMFNKALAG